MAIGQRLHPPGDIGVEFGDRDRAVVQEIRLALAEPFDQRLGKRAMAIRRRLLLKQC
jgi:hypothetical protein